MVSNEKSKEKLDWWSILSVGFAATTFSVMQALSYPLLAILLKKNGFSEISIGINAAAMPVGMFVAALSAGTISKHLGGKYSAIVSVILSAIFMGIIAVVPAGLWWMPLRFAIGFQISLTFIYTDTWINELVDNDRRGRVLGLYSTFLSLGFVLGPSVLALTGTQGLAPFVTGIASASLSAALLLTASGRDLGADNGQIGVPMMFVKAPLALLGVLVVALGDQGAMTLLPIFVGKGYASIRFATTLVALMSAGSLLFQYPIGWLSDSIGIERARALCALAAAAVICLWPMLFHYPWALALGVFLWGGIFFGVYTLNLAIFGNKFSGSLLISANAASSLAWSIGGIIGPPMLGGIMDKFGYAAFPESLGLIFISLGIIYFNSLNRK